MADEAVIRIILQDGGAPSGRSSAPSPSDGSDTSPPSQIDSPSGRSSSSQSVVMVPDQFRVVTDYLRELVDIRMILSSASDKGVTDPQKLQVVMPHQDRMPYDHFDQMVLTGYEISNNIDVTNFELEDANTYLHRIVELLSPSPTEFVSVGDRGGVGGMVHRGDENAEDQKDITRGKLLLLVSIARLAVLTGLVSAVSVAGLGTVAAVGATAVLGAVLGAGKIMRRGIFGRTAADDTTGAADGTANAADDIVAGTTADTTAGATNTDDLTAQEDAGSAISTPSLLSDATTGGESNGVVDAIDDSKEAIVKAIDDLPAHYLEVAYKSAPAQSPESYAGIDAKERARLQPDIPTASVYEPPMAEIYVPPTAPEPPPPSEPPVAEVYIAPAAEKSEQPRDKRGRYRKKNSDENSPDGEGMASGGWVGDHPGSPSGKDTEPAWLAKGEFVVNAESAAKNQSTLESINKGVRHMAIGGLVSGAATMIGDVSKHAANASDDPSHSIMSMGNAISSIGRVAGSAVPVIGAMIGAVGAVTSSLATMMHSLDGVADRYGQYSPEIAQAQGMSEVAQVMGDLRRSREIGLEMAEYTMARSDLQQKFEDIKVKLLTQIVPVVTRVMEIVEMILPSGESVGEALNALLSPISAIASAIGESVGMQREARMPMVDDPTSILFNEGLNGMQVPEGMSAINPETGRRRG